MNSLSVAQNTLKIINKIILNCQFFDIFFVYIGKNVLTTVSDYQALVLSSVSERTYKVSGKRKIRRI